MWLSIVLTLLDSAAISSSFFFSSLSFWSKPALNMVSWSLESSSSFCNDLIFASISSGEPGWAVAPSAFVFWNDVLVGIVNF